MSGEHPFHPQPGSNMCVCGRPVAHVTHHPPLDRIIRDRDEWNEHLANEASLLVMAIPRALRGHYLRRVARHMESQHPDFIERPVS